MPLTVQGKIEFLNKFISEPYYIGLFINSGSTISVNPGFSTTTKINTISALEIDKIEYERIIINPSDWTMDENSLSVSVSSSKEYAPKLQDWTDIQGYFLSPTLDNSGYLIYINVYDTKKNLTRNVNTLQIQPRIFFD